MERSRQYIAYHVDLFTYELKASDNEQAKIEAHPLLTLHPTIEVWQGPRFVGRLAREKGPAAIRGH
jgi:hypothetical protein